MRSLASARYAWVDVFSVFSFSHGAGSDREGNQVAFQETVTSIVRYFLCLHRSSKLIILSHPDKVKATINETAEDIANRFVDITKAYKSYVVCRSCSDFDPVNIITRLTDETIRRNWELYGHPDGRQEVSMGIALPKWIIEGKNNIWVLGVYGILFGGSLPTLVVCPSPTAYLVRSLHSIGPMVVWTPSKNQRWD